ncbi:MAG: uracil-DNA glycosylase [Xanthomonadaceae bacterium]|nr:uracil-DNA glycosylase [Xanthomonadaceae bacterium]
MTDWKSIIQDEAKKPYYQAMREFVQRERDAGKIIFPKDEWVYNALSVTPFNEVKVVILGQDPYHGEGQAHGLAFSVQKGILPPPSLRNIYQTLKHEYPEFNIPSHGNLMEWAEQGVLLLNTVLTVEKSKAHSHAKIGWETLTDRLISELNEKREQLVFVLWGAHAQKKGAKIDRNRHLVLTSVHPSPLSAYRGFFECGHFTKTNQYLVEHGLSPIDWSIRA